MLKSSLKTGIFGRGWASEARVSNHQSKPSAQRWFRHTQPRTLIIPHSYMFLWKTNYDTELHVTTTFSFKLTIHFKLDSGTCCQANSLYKNLRISNQCRLSVLNGVVVLPGDGPPYGDWLCFRYFLFGYYFVFLCHGFYLAKAHTSSMWTLHRHYSNPPRRWLLIKFEHKIEICKHWKSLACVWRHAYLLQNRFTDYDIICFVILPFFYDLIKLYARNGTCVFFLCVPLFFFLLLLSQCL